MIGAIIGDIAGSTYEFHSIKTKDFPLFAPGSNTTDDSLMSIAVASALMQTGEGGDFKASVVSSMRQIAAKYPCPMGGYGGALPALAGFAKSPPLRQLWERLRDARVPVRGRRRHAG